MHSISLFEDRMADIRHNIVGEYVLQREDMYRGERTLSDGITISL